MRKMMDRVNKVPLDLAHAIPKKVRSMSSWSARRASADILSLSEE